MLLTRIKKTIPKKVWSHTLLRFLLSETTTTALGVIASIALINLVGAEIKGRLVFISSICGIALSFGLLGFQTVLTARFDQISLRQTLTIGIMPFVILIVAAVAGFETVFKGQANLLVLAAVLNGSFTVLAGAACLAARKPIFYAITTGSLSATTFLLAICHSFLHSIQQSTFIFIIYSVSLFVCVVILIQTMKNRADVDQFTPFTSHFVESIKLLPFSFLGSLPLNLSVLLFLEDLVLAAVFSVVNAITQVSIKIPRLHFQLMLSQNSASEHNVIFTQLLNAFCLIALGIIATLLIPRFMDLRSSSLGSVSLLCWFQVCFFQKFQNSMQLRSKENISQAYIFQRLSVCYQSQRFISQIYQCFLKLNVLVY